MARAGTLLLMCGLLLWTTSLAGAAENLVTNGDFERGGAAGLEGWETKRPPGGKIEVVPGPRGRCARLNSTDRTGSTYLIQTIDGAKIKGQRLRFEAQMRAENVTIGTYPYSQAKATLVWKDELGDHDLEIDFLYTFGWRKISTVWTIGPNCTGATLYLGMHTTTGTVWFDDVTLAVSELQSEAPVAEGVSQQVFDDGTVLRVGGNEFTPVQLRPAQAPTAFAPTVAERTRGFVAFRPANPSAIFPGTVPTRSEVVSKLDLLAAPGQYEPLTFAVYALRPLHEMTAALGDMKGPQGATLPASICDARMGKYVIQRVGYTNPDYCILPKVLVRHAAAAVTPERPQLYWFTLHIPDEARPGDYKGTVRVTADGQALALPLNVRVPALRLGRPRPWMLFFYDSNPQDAELYFRDMREHGMTSVIMAQVQAPLRREGDRAVVDFTTSDAFVAAYRKVGFTDPLVYNPFHDRLATILLDRFGLADAFPTVVNYGETIRVFKESEYPASLHETYRQVVRDIVAHIKQAQWPETLFYPVDEPNEPGDWRMAAARLEYRLTREAAPNFRTFCTSYSIPVMQQLDPWLDVRACPIVPLVSDEKTHQAFQDYLKQTGGEIWGIDWPAMWDDFWRAREIAGFLPAKAGVTGMTSWTYYGPPPLTDEYDDLRGAQKRCVFTYRDTDGSLIPTTTWEGIRAGATDWRYVATLEQAVANATGAPKQQGQRVLDEVRASVPWRATMTDAWGNDRAQQLRAKVAEAIVRLQRAGRK